MAGDIPAILPFGTILLTPLFGSLYDRIGKGSRAYMKLADEFLLREKYRKRS